VVAPAALLVVDAAVSLTSTVRPARRECHTSIFLRGLLNPFCSDSEKKINQGWGAEEGNAELKAEEAAVKDANAEAAPTADAGDWTAPAADAGDWTAPAGDAAEWGAPPGDAAAPADGAAKPDREGRPPRREREPEEEDNTLTLEQYQAQKKESTIVPKLEGVRKANEGADSNIWKDAVPMQKDEEDAYFVGKVGPFFFLARDRLLT
jgi:plasminogen activator inhibitor 1 RNA-binding protein